MDDRSCGPPAFNGHRPPIEGGLSRSSSRELWSICPILGVANACHDICRDFPTSSAGQEVGLRTRLEATLATLSSSGIYNLIERFFAHRRQSQGTVFDIVRVEYPAVRRLVDERTPATGAEDNAWLRRTELRGQDAVIRYLEQNPVDLTRCLLALFVDERCGLIAYSCIGTSREITLSGTAARILQDASHHHSCAIILASNWSNPNLPNADREKLTVELFRKGEAIGIYLLDHFVRTPSGWSRMFAISEAQRP